jgi:hypothetical protein
VTLRFKYGKAEIVVRRATVRDDLHAQIIEARLKEHVAVGEWGHWTLFAELVSQTVSAKGLPFDPTTLLETENGALDAAYNAFLDSDKALKDLWQKTCNQANKTADEVLGPTPLADNADPT